MGPLRLREALARGAFLAGANWPVVIIDFVLESFYKAAVAVPIIGGALMVTAIVGTDFESLLADGVRAAADLILGSLATAPTALVSFLAAVAVVAFGGAAVLFTLKAGTLTVIIAAERTIGPVEAISVNAALLRRASLYSLQAIYDGVRRFGRRAIALSLGLATAYFCVGTSYLIVTIYGFTLAGRLAWLPAWPLLILAITSGAVVAVAVINLIYDLLRVVVIHDDCGVRDAARRVRAFIIEDARQVVGIFSVFFGLTVVATFATLLAATGLGLVTVLPFLSLVTAPLQIVAWIIRGLLFQYMSLAALGAYTAQYRLFSESRFLGPEARGEG